VDLVGHYSNPDDLLKKIRRLRELPRRPRSDRTERQRQVQRRLSESEVNALLGRHAAGASLDELAAEFGVHRTTVRNHLDRAGVERRSGFAERHVDEARALYESGLSLARVGKRLGVSGDTIRLVFRAHGIEVRDRPGWRQGPQAIINENPD
jgi:DNA-binding CsgD family transcriptional regulator